jgi:hypothetical protein
MIRRIVLSIILLIIQRCFQILKGELLVESLSKRSSSRILTESGNLEGTSGKLFEGNAINHFNGSRLFKDSTPESLISQAKKATLKKYDNVKCTNWAVVTTINPPTPAVIRQSEQLGWCLVVVGDKKGPRYYNLSTAVNVTIFLDVEQQLQFLGKNQLGTILPWNHFGRKNIGYLFAIYHRARAIFDFDDDNLLVSKRTLILVPGHAHHGHSGPVTNVFHAEAPVEYNYTVINPYPLLGSNVDSSWPRGYPLLEIKSTHFDHSRILPMKKVILAAPAVGVIQYLANHDPDVDAIYRLTKPLPMDFPIRGHTPIVIPEKNSEGKQVYCPYNAQATLHTEHALWTLLLPITVHGRVSDIWRGYFAQRLMSDIGIHLLFHPPIVVQNRNDHNYLADFDSEGPLYLQSGRLVDQLNEWYSCAKTLPGRIEDLWIMAYEHGYIGLKDVILIQTWLEALIEVGYEFPRIKNSRSSCV